MTTRTDVPSDYRLLVPRDWFRIDLTQERWRRQLKTFRDKMARTARTPDEAVRGIWATVRNSAENAAAQGGLELFLRTESLDDVVLPASLLVSMTPTPRGQAPAADDFAQELGRRSAPAAMVDVIELPAGETVRLRTTTTVDFHIRMPGDVGYLHLAFSAPLSGTQGPMGELCDAMAHSLRWV